MFVLGASQLIVIAASESSLLTLVGGSATLAAGSISKKFEKAAPCPAAFTKRTAYRRRAGTPANSRASIYERLSPPFLISPYGTEPTTVARAANSSSVIDNGAFGFFA